MRYLSAILMLWAVTLLSPAAFADVKKGDSPRFKATALDGKTHESSALKGKVVLVDFWATWCVPCRDALPFYAKLAEAHDGEFVVIAVSVDQKREGARKFVKAQLPGVSAQDAFIVAWSKDHGMAKQFGPTIFPTAYLIDRSGVVQNVYLGFDKASKKSSAEAIKKLVAQPAP